MPLHAVPLQPNTSWYPEATFAKLAPGQGFDNFFKAAIKDGREPHAPLVSKAVAAVLDPRIEVTMSLSQYTSFKANWTNPDPKLDMRVEVLLWTICRPASGNCYSATKGNITFDDSRQAITLLPPEPTSWHRVAQLQQAASPKLFKAGYVVGA